MADHILQKETKQQVAYSIASLILELRFPEGFKRRETLPSFEPFLVEYTADQKSTCTIELNFDLPPMEEDEGKLLSDISLVWGERFRFYEKKDCYITTVRGEEDNRLWKMKSRKDFMQSVIYILNEEKSINEVLSWLIMVAFGQTCLLHHAILIHASVISCNGRGYAFLGKSGTGKSTHSRLWLEHIEGTKLLNDDNPAIRLENNGQVNVYGTPWSGKTDCYKNMKVPMKAFVRLKQAANNQLSWKKGIEAFISVLPSCTAIRWNKRLFAEMNDTVEAIVQKVLVAELECLPNQESALLCYREITNENTHENQHS